MGRQVRGDKVVGGHVPEETGLFHHQAVDQARPLHHTRNPINNELVVAGEVAKAQLAHTHHHLGLQNVRC